MQRRHPENPEKIASHKNTIKKVTILNQKNEGHPSPKNTVVNLLCFVTI